MPLQLVVIDGPDKGRTVDLEPGHTLVVGRGTGCNLQLNDPHTSRTHCRIVVGDNRAVLVDAGSTYGTKVGGKKVSDYELQPNDVISLGETSIRFVDPTGESSKTLPPDKETQRRTDAGKKVTSKGKVHVDSRLRGLVGQPLARYQVQEAIAEGRTGIVFKAFEAEKDRTVALKVLWPELSRQEDEVQRFIRAIKTMLPIQHPNLVRLYRAGKTGDHCWMAMEYVEGESVARVIDRIGVGGMLDWEPAFRVAIHVARALELAHEHKIVHRNITPQNILIREQDKTVKLGDLMLAKALEGTQAATITKPGELIGELAYMAPEQTTGDLNADCRSDIYSLGATVYRLVAGRPPVEGRNPAETIVKIQNEEPAKPTKYQLSIPPLFEGVILKMLAKSPGERFQTPTQLIADLDRVARYQGLSGY